MDGIGLVGVLRRRAVVERAGRGREVRVAEAVAVAVGARIAGIADPVPIEIALTEVGRGGAVVAGVAAAVAVSVRLLGIGRLRAVVALVPRTVVVAIGLAGVHHGDATVAGVADRVVVGVGLVRIAVGGTGVAGVAPAVAVAVRLVGVGGDGAVVGEVADAVAVQVLPDDPGPPGPERLGEADAGRRLAADAVAADDLEDQVGVAARGRRAGQRAGCEAVLVRRELRAGAPGRGAVPADRR